MSQEEPKKIDESQIEVLDSIDELERKSKAYLKLKSYSESIKNPTAKKYIDWDEFELAAQRFLPVKDCAALLNVSYVTLNDRCKKEFGMTAKETWNKLAAAGKRVLSSKMYDKAVKEGNVTMQIWLSKAQLGYREPEKKPVNPGEGQQDQIKEIKWAPSIKGFENCTQDEVKGFMAEFLDLPNDHKLKQEHATGKKAEGVPTGDKDE